jgi:protein-L-isoaspartate(D-aspartate) O-methyltransferase
MRTVPRHEFVPADVRESAYRDAPLPIGREQTISQPYIVALMTEALRLEGGEKVLEIGTGSGYQAAVLAEIAGTVHSVELNAEIALEAAERLAGLGYHDVTVHAGNGFEGWLDEAPYDAIVVTAAPETVPMTLLQQLVPGGRLVVPVGRKAQMLQQWVREGERGFESRNLIPVSFVPMRGGPIKPAPQTTA